jgi:LacI family transcriptional regulator
LGWPLKRHHEVFAGIQAFAAERGDWVLMPDNYPQAVLQDPAANPPYDGVVGRLARATAEAAVSAGVPAVNVWINADPVPGVALVCADSVQSGRLAGEHFAARGIRRFVSLGCRGDRSSAQQRRGLRAVAHERGLSFSHHLCPFTVDESYERWQAFCRDVQSWLEVWQPPIGILVGYDVLCRQLAAVCLRSGWLIPEQIAMMGTGNAVVLCEAASPSLSSIDMGFFRVGYEDAKLLDAMMQGEKPPVKPVLIPPKGAILRRSTDAFAVADKDVSAALRYMAENYSQTISVDRIAKKVGVGRRNLERRFRATLGRSIINELNRLRVERMKRLLVETDLPVKYLVSEAGFGTPEHMRNVFRKNEGMTPSVYREQQTH